MVRRCRHKIGHDEASWPAHFIQTRIDPNRPVETRNDNQPRMVSPHRRPR
jgi:hypothetical protein